MATVKEWEEACEKLSVDELDNVSIALETLQAWDFFTDQYVGLNIILVIVSNEYLKQIT